MAPVRATQLNCTEEVVNVPQLTFGVNKGFTTKVIVVVVAHCPASGVNVKVFVPDVAVLTRKIHEKV